jgi:hypothetical protein
MPCAWPSGTTWIMFSVVVSIPGLYMARCTSRVCTRGPCVTCCCVTLPAERTAHCGLDGTVHDCFGEEQDAQLCVA